MVFNLASQHVIIVFVHNARFTSDLELCWTKSEEV
jgi:hypothetical protein